MIQSPQNKWHWFGTFSVAPNGRIDAVWYDTRNAANNIDSQLFYSWSTDGGVTWAPNVAVSNPFNPQAGFPQQRKDRRLHHYCFGHYRRQCGVCRHLQCQSERRRRARTRRLLRARVSDGRRHADADTYSASTPTHALQRHSYSYTYSYTYGHTNGNSYCYSQTDTDA